MTKTTIVLPLMPTAQPVLILGCLPGFTGNEPVDLLCGGCKEVLGQGVSLDFFKRTMAGPGKLIVQCPCGAHNLLPSQDNN